ncbi:polymorphic toxin-type HINT domain-containing protein [Streptomyces sp. NPDC086091]|uniref:polymorphic toxin-type HINT domain-containing protein n=1 Tax=Streptomyces sp. NPDC086091 TaxID=3365751 RepID=UPI0037FF622E
MHSLALALVLPLGVAQAAQAAADPEGLGRPDLPEPRVSKVQELKGPAAKQARRQVARDRKANTAQAARAEAERRAVWPTGGEAQLVLTKGRKKQARPAGVPVTLTPSSIPDTAAAGAARITVLDQRAARKAGITGVLLAADAETAGDAELSVDYSGFASALGGGWSQRLSLVQLPACALTTPQKAECRRQRVLRSDNDVARQAVSARIRLADAPTGTSAQLMRSAGTTSTSTVLAVTASAAGSGQSPKGTGDYSATPLNESSSWQAGGNSGSFNWSYDFTMPPSAAGPVPPFSLSYDSGSIDGRTATTNNQGTSVGEGFTLSESYIERTYGSCDKDGHEDVFDLCWKYDNARLVLNGKSSRLVKDADGDWKLREGEESQWRLESDDASRVTRSTGADNGDDNGEHWTVITGDGTKYVFGLNKLSGADTQRTNSVWNAPVFGDDSGEPGYAGGDSFADRSLTQAWRWNLDYVEDANGNAVTYWYTKESNYYKKNKATKANAAYTRGGYLNRVEYGLRAGALFTDKADAKVTFSYAERCTASDCSSLTESTADNWPDVPFDSICSDDDTECDATAPAFFSRKRLTGIDTFSYNITSTAYDPVDSWELTQRYLDGGDIGDSSDQVLTLQSLQRTGKAAETALTLHPVAFTYHMRPNRVDATDNILPITRPRISTITSETGAITTVTLSGAECVRSQVLDAPPDSNTRSCYPQFWNINGAENASIDWFHKYRVLAVTESDPAAANETVEESYSYSGAAWHYNNDPFTPADERTWSDWRGYRQVTTWSGATDVTRSRTVSLYLQGMHGDKNKDGTTKSVSVAPLASPELGAPSLTDTDHYAGHLRQQVTYDGATAVSATISDPDSEETARQDAPGAGDHVARYIRTKKTRTYTYLTASQTWRERQSTTTFDSYGMPVTVEDSGQVGVASDETCTRTWYARNPDRGLTNLIARTRTVGRSCATTDGSLNLPAAMDPADPKRGDVLADAGTVYDTANVTTWSPTQKPTKGHPTWTGRPTGYSTTVDADGERVPSAWQRGTTATYDALGRSLSVSDATTNAPTTTAYTPTDSGPLTRTVVTNPKQHKTITFVDPRRGSALRTYDANSNKTEMTYDALGRLTQVWLPNRSSGSQGPNQKFSYHLETTKPSWVSTSALNKDGTTYDTSYALYDSLMRPLQSQTTTPQGGRLLTDVRYDSRGLAYEAYADIFDTSSTPNGTYVRAEYGEAPTQTQTVFDGAGRETTSTLFVFGVKKWETTTSYTGDSVATTALEGGSARRTISDIRGQTTETRTYSGVSPADTAFGTGPGAPYVSTKSAYELDGQQKTLNGPDDATWSYTYDLFGRQATVTDPDTGKTKLQYDALDRVVKSTDARGSSVVTAYDELGRVTGTWTGSQSDANQLTGLTYDTPLKGLPTSSTRFVGGKTGPAYTQTVTAYDSLSRPTATQLQLPASDPFAATASTLAFETYYNLDGTIKGGKLPAMGGLPSENLDYGYNSRGDLLSLSGATGYVRDISYSALAEPQQLTLGTGGSGNKSFYVTNTFEQGTGRLTRSHVTDQTHPYMLQDLNYAYDQSGNVTSISDPTLLGGTSTAETQCFAYDGYQRLTEAWTPTSQRCEDSRSATSLSGPAPYWSSYAYNSAGQRTSETTHKTSGDAKTTYCYKKPTQPHTLTGTTTGTDCAAPERSYLYDATGNTTQRPGSTAPQNLLWSDEGKLSKLTESGKATDYLYDASGELLIRTTQNGERVLYTGATELHLRADGTTWAQRYYTAGDVTVAVRSNQSGTTKLTYLTGDAHNTSSLALNPDAGQTFTKRYTTPFGADRGSPQYGPWPDDKGFLGKTRDATTGLTHVGAREYDPSLGQFISVDPVLAAEAPQSLNGYSYAGNNPVTKADPTGLCPFIDCPTRSTPDHENSTPGKRPGPAKKSSNTIAKESREAAEKKWVASTTPSSKDARQLGMQYKLFGTNNLSRAGDYWAPQTNIFGKPETVCFGRQGCNAAYAYYLDNPDDAEGAKRIAATYCIVHMSDCEKDARISGQTTELGNEAVMLLSLVKGIQLGGGASKLSRTCTKCFLAGTEVLLADGSAKRIEEVKVGDEVVATDPETGETGPREVLALIVTEHDKYFNELSIATDDGVEKLTATFEHPFWSPSEHAWVDAAALKSGMTLLTDKGDTVIVVGNRPFAERARTYNLTVDDLHTYYVLAGETPVLVHNSGGCPDLDALSQSGMRPAKGKTTHAGREYQKHMNRGDLPVVPGKELKTAGQDLLDDILTNPQTATSAVNSGNFAGGSRYIMPDPAGGRGIGATFDANGQFQYFGRY